MLYRGINLRIVMQTKDCSSYVLGITGQAGSGKSTLAYAFQELGAALIDADLIAKDLVNSDSEIHNLLRKTFGDQFFDQQGQLKRRELGQHVFNNDEHLNQLNVIVWPRMIRTIFEKVECYKNKGIPLIVIDMAVLYETDLDAVCDQVIAMVAPYHQLFERIKERNGWSDDEVKKRLGSQQSSDALRKKADILVENDGDKSLLYEIAKDIYLSLDVVRNNVC